MDIWVLYSSVCFKLSLEGVAGNCSDSILANRESSSVPSPLPPAMVGTPLNVAQSILMRIDIINITF